MDSVVELVREPETDVVSVVVNQVERVKIHPNGQVECLD
jgi:hypothetical protein